MADGTPAYKWNRPGLQSNYYYETVAENPLDRVLLEINQIPDDDQKYDKDSFTTDFDESLLDLPAACSGASACGVLSTCTAVGSGLADVLGFK